MSKQRLARILTVLILAAALGVTMARKNGWTLSGAWTGRQTVEATPEDAIYAMLDAARQGDVKKYLGCYSAEMQTS